MKNKTKLIRIAFASLFIFNSNYILAQESEKVCKPHEFTVGVLGGANLSLLYAGSNEINKNYGFGIGYNAGLTSSYGLNNHLSIVTEVNFAQLSSERKDMQPLLSNSPLQNPGYPLFASFKKTETYDYFEVPLMIRVTTGNKVKFYANVGPYIGFIAKAKLETSGRSMLYTDLAGQSPQSTDNSIYSMDGSENTTSSINTVNFGLTGGLGIGYTFGKSSIVFDARCDIGLTNIRNNSAVNGRNNLQTIMAGIGYNYVLFR